VKQRITLHIDRLVLDRGTAGTSEAYAARLKAEITRHLAEAGAAPFTGSRSGHVETARVPRVADAGAVGHAVATTILGRSRK
jgi:hypothetical protein